MPQRRLRRVGSTAAASAGALTIILFTAGPADASTTGACPPATDPASTLKNLQCRLDKLIGKKTPTSSPSPTKAVTKKSTTPKKTTASPKKAAASHGTRHSAPAPSGASRGTPASASAKENNLTPYAPTGNESLPGLLPQPDVASEPLPAGARPEAAVLQTRLMAPMAAEGRDNTQIVWVAAAAGLAGAVGALNIGVAGRRLRTRAR